MRASRSWHQRRYAPRNAMSPTERTPPLQRGSSSWKIFPRCQRRGARASRKPAYARSGRTLPQAHQNAKRGHQAAAQRDDPRPAVAALDPIPAVRRQSGNLSGSEPQSCRSSSASRWLIVTRSGPRSELEVALVRASLLAHGSRGDSRQPDRPLMSRERQQVPARDHLAPGIDAPSQGRHYRGGASYARLRSVARGPPGDRARIPLGSDGSRSE